MPELKRQNGSLYYETSGEGPPLVLLRGLGRSIRHWLGYDQELSNHFKVITLDMRGIGRSTLPHSPLDSLYDLAEDVEDILNELQIDQAHILGVSLGGMVALAMGISCPRRCISIVTVNTSIAGQGLMRLSIPAVKVLLEGVVLRKKGFHSDLAEILVGSDISKSSKIELGQKFEEIAAIEGVGAKTASKQLVSAARFFAKKSLRKMSVPTLVVYGTEDRLVPVANSKKLFKLLPDANLLAINGGGHELFVDKGDELTAELQKWVKIDPCGT